MKISNKTLPLVHYLVINKENIKQSNTYSEH